jgi:hydrogenase maturation protease
MTPSIAVVGCGNPVRQDDGIGSEVIGRLKQGSPDPRVKLLDAGTDGVSVMFAARGCSTLIVVDAARVGIEHGAIYEVPGSELEREYRPTMNLHDFRWNDALHAGRKMYGKDFPADVTVLLVEAAELGFGVGLSPPVVDAVPRVVNRIEALIAERLAGESADDRPGAVVRLHRGGLYLSRQDCARYFGGIDAVILLRRDGDLLVLPVRHAAAGGYLLKVRNGDSDRVVQAPEFFRQNGIPDEDDFESVARWDTDQGGLVAEQIFPGVK